jgi:putative transposase
MPWSESRVDARMKFVQEFSTGSWSVVELARRHGISRKTAYKILDRFIEEGVCGLEDRSRARHRQAHQTPEIIERKIIAAKRRYPFWGPRKLRVLLQRQHPELDWPAKSTIGDILQRHGLVTPRRKRRAPSSPPHTTLDPVHESNDVWCTDFKGYRLSGAGERLEPFTLGDAYSRYSLACTLVDSIRTDTIWPIFVRSFREYGLPRRVRSDNGPPFASTGLGGLSSLGVRFIRLGIRPERIDPGRPQQNGMLERFHLTLQLEAMSPPASTRRKQERVLRRFRDRFNRVRPHEALGDLTPAAVYETSPRSYPGRIPELEYPSHVPVRRVRSNGAFRWGGHDVFLSETVIGERIGFRQSSTSTWSICLGPLEVGLWDDKSCRLLTHARPVWRSEWCEST